MKHMFEAVERNNVNPGKYFATYIRQQSPFLKRELMLLIVAQLLITFILSQTAVQQPRALPPIPPRTAEAGE